MSYSSTVLADSPFSYYHLNETSGTNAADSSGNGHDATYNGTVTLNQTGRIVDAGSAAVLLNGSSGYISCPSTGVPTGNANFTQELWVKLTSTGSTMVLISWGTGNTLQEPNLYVDSSGNLQMSTWNTDTTVQALSTGVWYHLVSTWDGTTHTAYVNGVSKATSTPGTVATPASPAFTIGRNANPSEYFAAMTVQEPAGYATCLSPARILAHYQAGITYLGVATMVANAVVAESAIVHAPATLASNAAVAESAILLTAAALVSSAALAESAQIVSGATVQGNAAMPSAALLLALATLASNATVSEAARIVASAALVANAVLAASGFVPSTFTRTPTAVVTQATRPTATVVAASEPSGAVAGASHPSAVVSRL